MFLKIQAPNKIKSKHTSNQKTPHKKTAVNFPSSSIEKPPSSLSSQLSFNNIIMTILDKIIRPKQEQDDLSSPSSIRSVSSVNSGAWASKFRFFEEDKRKNAMQKQWSSNQKSNLAYGTSSRDLGCSDTPVNNVWSWGRK
jgi:hypothetical protein